MGQSIGTDDFMGDDDILSELESLGLEHGFEDTGGAVELPSYLMPEAPTSTPLQEGGEGAADASANAEGLDAYGLPMK
jgi:hypothetical protein